MSRSFRVRMHSPASGARWRPVSPRRDYDHVCVRRAIRRGQEHERRAAVILDGMYQFVALSPPTGEILEVNCAALEGAGHRIQELRGTPFWTARWWQISAQTRRTSKCAIGAPPTESSSTTR